MSMPPAGIPLDAPLEDAARHMADAGVGALPVVEDDHVVGVITDRDLVVRAMARGLSPQVRVEALMSTDPVTVEADTPVPAAMHAMGTIDARHLPVVDRGGLSEWFPSTTCSGSPPAS
ncbi:CBS domain-containing protein [Streptomyces sp. GS7]|uniref:CBS domain-containing protein n=1 Tax=Streptomyces sp. GS7 TaxID=2692234 RepID=UPI0013173C43|nr:CBS domain-containing protein [Streptomyces sp. GS7]QHC23026.1 CBS domain-containing protein [Streptomyces sp. GS7]